MESLILILLLWGAVVCTLLCFGLARSSDRYRRLRWLPAGIILFLCFHFGGIRLILYLICLALFVFTVELLRRAYSSDKFRPKYLLAALPTGLVFCMMVYLFFNLLWL